ncbi:pilus assembly PilX family protein [Methylococcus mesophilus]|uniref:pilus assembly PilX family protein n=1 Tax=Methylococcus mesophilus TaxID=2993564 RepID=UPI00224A8887|nr:pilus assembly PilX N-terminal domain-containing protein [Methylococcus mesophilus]UZR27527.1 pilus assembly PilX N-terminal domain-containing protein [Methylococcus mesophilus]
MARKRSSQNGAALVVGMLFTIVLTVLGIAAIHSSSTSVRMARNAEARINGLQQAQAASDYVAAEALDLNLDRMGSHARCTASYPYGGCNGLSLPTLPSPLLTPPVHVRVRSSVAFGSSKSEESNKVFERVIDSDYDGSTAESSADATRVGVVSAVRGTIVSSGSVRYDSETPDPTPTPAATPAPTPSDDGDHEGDDDHEDGDGDHDGGDHEDDGEQDDGENEGNHS